MDKRVFFAAFKAALFDGFFDEKNGIDLSGEELKRIRTKLALLEPDFVKGSINSEELVERTKTLISEIRPQGWNPGRDICIALWAAVGAAIFAAWVASGGTLAVGTVVAGVTVSHPILVALVGGASGATIACMLGGCGDC